MQDFVVSFFVELSVMMLERLFLDPGTKEVGTIAWSRVGMGNDKLTTIPSLSPHIVLSPSFRDNTSDGVVRATTA